MNFRAWIEQNTVGTEFVDESKIDVLYDKAKLSVKIVQIYDETRSNNPNDPPEKRKLLLNINTILPLNSSAYGLYASAENKKIIGGTVLNQMKLIFPKDQLINQKLQNIPNSVIKKYIPNVDERLIRPSDTIHVNIVKTVKEYGDSKEAIIEIASTIVHEATHELELQTYGKTDETGPQKAEKQFIAWVQSNWAMLLRRIPELASM